MRLNTFFRCYCGKIHTFGGIHNGSVCTCGRNLMTLIFGAK